MIVDQIHCPTQEAASFTFDACRRCKFFQLNKGKTISVSCRKNKVPADRRAYESAFLSDWLGYEWAVEIIAD